MKHVTEENFFFILKASQAEQHTNRKNNPLWPKPTMFLTIQALKKMQHAHILKSWFQFFQVDIEQQNSSVPPQQNIDLMVEELWLHL